MNKIIRRKILGFALILLLFGVLSACSRSKPKAENNLNPKAKNSLNKNNSNSADGTVKLGERSKLNSLNENNTRNNKVNNNSASPKAEPPITAVKNKNIMPAPDQQKDLISKYSRAIIKTNFGSIALKFYPKEAPLAVNNFMNLAQAGFYNGTKFHRIIKGFMIQGGDPLTKGTDTALYGTGGPGYQFKNEIGSHKLVEGSIAMANSGPDTNGSQFFIVTAKATPWLDGSYTNFGKLSSGLDTVHKIEDIKVVANPSNPREISFPTQDAIIESIELLK